MKRRHSSLQQQDNSSAVDNSVGVANNETRRRLSLHHVGGTVNTQVAAQNFHQNGGIPMEASFQFLNALRGLQGIPPPYLSALQMQHASANAPPNNNSSTDQLIQKQHPQWQGQKQPQRVREENKVTVSNNNTNGGNDSSAVLPNNGTIVASSAAAAPSSSRSKSSTSLWERKCTILMEELEFRKQQNSELEEELENEVESRTQQEGARKQQQVDIQNVSLLDNNRPGQEAAKILKQQVEKQRVVRKLQENDIHTQHIAIAKLTDEMKKAKLASQAPRQTVSESKQANSSGEINNIRDQLIKSRSKQVELVRSVESWKQKAFALQQKLESVDQDQDQNQPPSVSLPQAEDAIKKYIKTEKLAKNENSEIVKLSTKTSKKITETSATIIEEVVSNMQDVKSTENIDTNAAAGTGEDNGDSGHGVCTAPTPARCFDGTQRIRTKKVKRPLHLLQI